MARNPSLKAILFRVLMREYGAMSFPDALGDFIAQCNYPEASTAALHRHSSDTLLTFRAVPVYHNIKFTADDNSIFEHPEIIDAVHIRPEQKDSHGRTIPERFDTVLVRDSQRNKGTF